MTIEIDEWVIDGRESWWKGRVYKINERNRLLAEHPDLRIRIDTQALKEIIDYDEFRCEPSCSIAHNRAIKGSDIDGGLVILRDPVEVNRRIVFIGELRRQGFRAHDISEHEKALQALKAYAESPMKLAFHNLVEAEVGARYSLVRFITREELAQLEGNNIFPATDIRYISRFGFKIE